MYNLFRYIFMVDFTDSEKLAGNGKNSNYYRLTFANPTAGGI